MELTPIAQRFILHWGEMGTRWGVNRTVAQIHALLYLAGTPLHAEEIAETLDVARSNVSNSLKELQNWNLVKLVHVKGDRRDFFETLPDVWALFKIIAKERQQRELEPTVHALRDYMNSPEWQAETEDTHKKIKETLDFMETLTWWGNEMLKLDPSTLVKLMKMGSSVQKIVGGIPLGKKS